MLHPAFPPHGVSDICGFNLSFAEAVCELPVAGTNPGPRLWGPCPDIYDPDPEVVPEPPATTGMWPGPVLWGPEPDIYDPDPEIAPEPTATTGMCPGPVSPP